jgi:AcrR family transcriptional regulator
MGMARGQRKQVTDEETAETRRTILRTAEQLFMTSGYRAVSTRQIADACGLTQPALYHYFADKQSLYVEVIKENIAKTRSALERIVRRHENIQERLTRIVRYLLNSSPQDLGMMLHDIRQELDAESQEQLGVLFHIGIIGPLASLFEEGLQQGFLRNQDQGGADAVTAAYLLMHLLSGDLSRSSHQRSLASPERAEMMTQIFLYGLASTDHGHHQGRWEQPQHQA